MSRVVVLSGATGFIGRRLAEYLLTDGWQVRGIARDIHAATASGDPRIVWYAGDLSGQADPTVWRQAQVLIHAAWSPAHKQPEKTSQENREGSQRLFAQALDAGIAKRIFLSSMSAHERALSAYGKSKFAVEAMLRPQQDLVVRPGFVIGNGGVHAAMTRAIEKSIIIPSFYGGQQLVQPIAVDDLCLGICAALARDVTGRVTYAEEAPITVDVFYRAIADSLGQTRKPIVHFPGQAAAALLAVCERIGLSLPMTTENLLGLKALEPTFVADDLRRVGLAPKPYREALADLAALRRAT